MKHIFRYASYLEVRGNLNNADTHTIMHMRAKGKQIVPLFKHIHFVSLSENLTFQSK